MSPEAPEGELAGFLRHRDEEGFRRLYSRCTPKMIGLATRMLGSPADVSDVVQEAWVRVVRDLERFEGRSRFDTWVLGYVVRCCREVWRRRGIDERRAVPLECAGGEVETEGGAQRERSEAVDLEAALCRLAPGYRSVLLLHDLYGFTHEETAAALDVAVGTTKSQLARARAAMRRALEAAPRAVAGAGAWTGAEER